jgi:hypothetical protein
VRVLCVDTGVKCAVVAAREEVELARKVRRVPA